MSKKIPLLTLSVLILIAFLLIGLFVNHTYNYFASRADYAEVYLNSCKGEGICNVLSGSIKKSFIGHNYTITTSKGEYIVNESAIYKIKYKEKGDIRNKD